MIRLNIGSDVCRIGGMVNIDIRPEVGPDIVMDICRMSFRDKCADEINMGNVLEHLPLRIAYEGLAECRRVLSDSGILYITVPLIDRAEISLAKGEINEEQFGRIVHGEGDGPNSHKQEFRTGDVERLLMECGFSSERLILEAFPYIVVSNVNDPKIDPWQYGVEARKI